MATVQLTTERGEELQKALAENPNHCPWDVYPRPQMVREGWLNLNGRWDFCALTPKQTQAGQKPPYDRKILVPFPVESQLSGIGEHFPEGSCLFYRTRFVLNEIPEGRKLLLHCGGIEQTAKVFWNGAFLGDRTAALTCDGGLPLPAPNVSGNELVLVVTDDLRKKSHPYGKQTRKRGGMWYTPVSGIWQTVWLEWVPENHISRLEILPALDRVTVTVYEAVDSASPEQEKTASAGSIRFAGKDWPLTDGKAVIQPEHPHLWTPEDPYLYDFTVKTETDKVKSYFALRTFAAKTVDGVPRLCLNGKPIFCNGLLDQGYWPDGIYTPASPDCYKGDILAAKRLGFNTLRKHIKIEPAQFYYDCDRLGMLVFQDMVNNGRYSFFGDTLLPTLGLQRLPDWLPLRRQATKDCFRSAMTATVQRLYNHPCIVYWTIFNEGWGQFAPSENYDRLKALDPTRVIDTTSGWFRGAKTDVESRHVYFRRFRLPKSDKPVVLSEFGGYVWKVEGHSFNPDKTYGYKLFADRQSWQAAVESLYREQIRPNIEQGLCAAIYTQLSDVEDETNGLLTYDRRNTKPRR